ncbi:MAG: hypothetical protein LBD40_04190 [Puniceicoccales bacterium]|jgi:hypothetical protein|nr:hypothetical protein [Puniceicoccales bacterium]
MNYKIRNISLLCVLLSLSAGSAVAEPGPILSPDGTAFQLNFPQVIVDELNKFIVGVEGHERYGAFINASSGPLSCENVQQEFWKTIGATAPYIDISPKKRESLLTFENLIRTAQTLLILNHEKIFIPTLLVVRIQIALDYFLSDHAGMNYTSSCGNCPRRRQRLNPNQQAIEEYKSSLEEVVLAILK